MNILTHKIWTTQEIQSILYDLKSNCICDICKKYNRSPTSILEKLKRENINISNINYSNWSIDDKNNLIINYDKLSYKQLSLLLNKEIYDIKFMSSKLNLGKKEINQKNIKRKKHYVPPHEWSNDEDNYLIKNFQLLSFDEMEKTLNVSKKMIYTRSKKLGLERNNIRIKKESFTIYELETLKTYYNNIPLKELLKLIPRKTEKQIERKAGELKLKNKILTIPEQKTKVILQELNITFEEQKRFNFKDKYYIVDFLLPNENIIIEVNGDYWHGNPLIYQKEQLNNLQLDLINRDINKKNELENIGYKVIYLWEYDLINNIDKCKSIILNALLQQ